LLFLRKQVWVFEVRILGNGRLGSERAVPRRNIIKQLYIRLYSSQPEEPGNRNYYGIRTGKGNFAIFKKTGSGRLSE